MSVGKKRKDDYQFGKNQFGKNNPMFGKHHSEETRKKIRDSMPDNSGGNNPMFGKHHSEETKKKMSEVHSNPSEGTRKKMSIAKIGNKYCLGNKLTDEAKKKISEATRGQNHPLFGKKHTEQTKEKIGNTNRGKIRSDETKKKIGNASRGRPSWNLGKKTPKEVREKMSRTTKNQWQNPKFAEKMLKAFDIKPTKPETQMNNLLQELFPREYKYVGDGEFWIAGKNPDFINVNSKKKIIEVYGEYWHRNDNPKDRIDLFEPYGYQTLIIWEDDLREDIGFVRQKVKEFHNLKH